MLCLRPHLTEGIKLTWRLVVTALRVAGFRLIFRASASEEAAESVSWFDALSPSRLRTTTAWCAACGP